MSASTPTVADMAAHERPRERLAALGAAALSDAELVAIQLGSGRRGESALALAQALLVEFGGVDSLSKALPEELSARPGVGAAKAARLVSAFALASRVTGSALGASVRSSADIARVVQPLLARERVEKVVTVVCDHRNRVCRVAAVAQGGAGSCPVPVREILSLVLRHDGVAFAVAHNHPSGSTEVDDHDREVTTALDRAARAVGLRFLDHLVIAGNDWRSVTPSR